MLLHPSGLFCLDATHGLNDTGHQVFSLLHISDNRTGVIVMTFTVPNDHDYTHILGPLRWLKREFPLWEPYLFMTDDCAKGVQSWTCCCVLRACHSLPSAAAEFKALSMLFPNALLRLCIFHVKRNVTAEVRRSLDADTATKVDSLLERMSRLTPCDEDRTQFIAFVRALHSLVIGDDADALRDHADLGVDEIVKNLQGVLFLSFCTMYLV